MVSGLHYNGDLSPWLIGDDKTEKGLTCSDWGMLALFGIDARYSKWEGNKNFVGAGFDKLKEIFKYKEGRNFASEQIAKYIDDNHLSYMPDSTFSNVRAGDILFYDLDPNNDNDNMYYPPTGETLKRYKGVDHCAVVASVISEDYYSVFSVSGSVQSDDGQVKKEYLPIDYWNVVTALHNDTSIDYHAELLTEYHVTVMSYENERVITLSNPIPKDKWITVLIKAKRKGTSYIGIQAKYVGDNSYTSIASEIDFGRGVNAKGSLSVLIKTANPIESIKVISYGYNGGDRGFMISDIEVYNGYYEK